MTRIRFLYLALGALVFQLVSTKPVQGQSDPGAVAILKQSLAALGAANPVNPMQDFVATGTITYFWAGEQVQGPATVRAAEEIVRQFEEQVPSKAKLFERAE